MIKMNFYTTILTLAAERYKDARRHENGAQDQVAMVARATENIMCCLADDIEDGLYSEDNEQEQKRIAAFVAEENGVELSDIL